MGKGGGERRRDRQKVMGRERIKKRESKEKERKANKKESQLNIHTLLLLCIGHVKHR